MSRIASVVVVILLAGCEAFQAHQDTVAKAAEQTLSVQRLSELAGNGKVVPLRVDAMARVADLWIDYTLLANALISGDSLTDSATLADVAWPDLSQAKMDRLHDRLSEQVGTLGPQTVDSAYTAGTVRYLQHILIAVQQADAPPVKAQRRRQAEQVRQQVLG
ncbi:MAG: hypothetical protein ACREN5_05685, partial [Gemmatimonadales bacterium]